MAEPIQLLQADYVERAKGRDFERLCLYLLDAEVNRRHRGGVVDGNPPAYVKDGGVDIRITITQEPRVLAVDFPHAFTPDIPTIVAVACKTGDEWRSSLKNDAKKTELVNIVKNGHAIMFVHQQIGAVEKSNLHQEVVEILSAECNDSVEAIAQRVRLFDANDIAGFYAYRPIRLDLGLRLELAIPNFDGLLTLEEWAAQMRHSRPEPLWIADDVRERAVSGIRDSVNRPPTQTQPNVIWVSGPPGVGKSRLVIEALRAPEISGRVLASSDFQFGLEAIHGSEASRLGDGILVVDECSAADVNGLAGTFAGRAGGQGATLILIGPPDRSISAPFTGLRFMIEPLEADSERALIESELGAQANGELITRITHLTEGFPWFGVLLAQALRDDPTALPATASRWDAAALAIAGPKNDYGNNQTQQAQEAELRAKALLAIMMTEGTPWDSLTTDQETRLGLALDTSWSDVKAAAIRCYNRGLVRERQDWRFKYVTPRNIGRLVAAHLLPAPLSIGTRIRDHVPEMRAYLYGRLQDAELPPADLQTLSIEDVRPFELHPSWESLDHLPLSFLAHYAPDATARAVRKFVEAQPLGDLTAHRESRRNLVFGLEHVCRRKQGFLDAERALFRLALAENETYGNNATGVWESLFLGILSLTHLSFDRRLDVLESRLQTPNDDELKLSVKGLSHAIGQEFTGPAFTEDDKVDGDWYQPTWPEVRQGKLRAWRMLLKLIHESQNENVRNELCKLAADHLRSTLTYGIAREVIELLLTSVESWPSAAKARLRESISDIREFEGELRPELGEALNALREAISPTDYHGRLLDVTGNWHPAGHLRDAEQYGALQAREAQLDLELATDGLTGEPPPLLNEIDWLSSEAAVRAGPFMVQVGLLDKDLRLLEPLVASMATGQAANSFSLYLTGVAQGQGQERVDPVLKSLKDDPRYAWAFVLTIWRAGLSNIRVQWLEELVEAGKIDGDYLRPLENANWLNVDAAVLKSLVDVLCVQDSAVARNVALNIVLNRIDDFTQIDLKNVLLQVSDGFVNGTMEAHYWELAARKLLQLGDIEAVITAASLVVAKNEQFHGDEGAWKILRDVSQSHPLAVWEALVPYLERKDATSFHIILEMQTQRFLGDLPVEPVMAWVGDDETRATWAALMCNVQEATLSPVVRELIIRFGPESDPARELAARAGSTDGVVSSIAGHAKRQVENARVWAMDPNPLVAQWGRQMVEHLEGSYEMHAAWEEFQDRQR